MEGEILPWCVEPRKIETPESENVPWPPSMVNLAKMLKNVQNINQRGHLSTHSCMQIKTGKQTFIRLSICLSLHLSTHPLMIFLPYYYCLKHISKGANPLKVEWVSHNSDINASNNRKYAKGQIIQWSKLK